MAAYNGICENWRCFVFAALILSRKTKDLPDGIDHQDKINACGDGYYRIRRGRHR